VVRTRAGARSAETSQWGNSSSGSGTTIAATEAASTARK